MVGSKHFHTYGAERIFKALGFELIQKNLSTLISDLVNLPTAIRANHIKYKISGLELSNRINGCRFGKETYLF